MKSNDLIRKEKNMSVKFRMAIFLGIILALLAYGFAFASAVTVDGNPAEWLPASLVAQTTTNTGAAVPSAISIQEVYFTNDVSKIFFRLETAAVSDWSQAGLVAICLGTEAAADAAFGPCTSDYTLVLDNMLGTATLVHNALAPAENATGIEVAVDGTTTEISILLANLNITTSNCAAGCTITAKIVIDASIYDGGLGTDYTETTFTDGLPVGNGSPTSLNVTTFTAQVSALKEQTNWLPLWMIIGLAGIILGMFLIKRAGFRKTG